MPHGMSASAAPSLSVCSSSSPLLSTPCARANPASRTPCPGMISSLRWSAAAAFSILRSTSRRSPRWRRALPSRSSSSASLARSFSLRQRAAWSVRRFCAWRRSSCSMRSPARTCRCAAWSITCSIPPPVFSAFRSACVPRLSSFSSCSAHISSQQASAISLSSWPTWSAAGRPVVRRRSQSSPPRWKEWSPAPPLPTPLVPARSPFR